MDTTQSIETFEIYELQRNDKFTFPVISFYECRTRNHAIAYLNVKACDLLSKESASNKLAFARRQDKVYIAALPELSELSGYAIQRPSAGGGGSIGGSGVAAKFRIDFGNYEINESPIFHNDISWFELIPLND